MKIILLLISVLFILSLRDTSSQVSEMWVKRYTSSGSYEDKKTG